MKRTVVVVYGFLSNKSGDKGLSDKTGFFCGDESGFNQFWQGMLGDWLYQVHSNGFTPHLYAVTYLDTLTGKSGTLYTNCK